MSDSELFEAVRELPKAERAALRRCCGMMLKEASGQAITTFYRCLPYGTPTWKESRCFAAACLACLWDEGVGTPMETILAVLKNQSDSLEKRISSLLDMRWDEDGFFLGKLVRIVKMAKQKGFTIDCEKLLADLCNWNSDKQYVQRKWAKALYVKNDNNTEEDK